MSTDLIKKSSTSLIKKKNPKGTRKEIRERLRVLMYLYGQRGYSKSRVFELYRTGQIYDYFKIPHDKVSLGRDTFNRDLSIIGKRILEFAEDQSTENLKIAHSQALMRCEDYLDLSVKSNQMGAATGFFNKWCQLKGISTDRLPSGETVNYFFGPVTVVTNAEEKAKEILDKAKMEVLEDRQNE